MKVNAWNAFSVIPENSRLVAVTDHDALTITQALDAAEDLAKSWNEGEGRSNMLVTMLTCSGFIRNVPIQNVLF